MMEDVEYLYRVFRQQALAQYRQLRIPMPRRTFIQAMEPLLRTAAVTFAEGEVLPDRLEEAKINLRLLIAEIAIQSRKQLRTTRREVVTEEVVRLSLSEICPIWPFC
jgi:hypothetical protein